MQCAARVASTQALSAADLFSLVCKAHVTPMPPSRQRPCSPGAACAQGIYPLQNTYIRKAKLLRAPRFDITKLMELHAGADLTTGGAVGERIDRPEGGQLIPEAEQREIEGDY